MWLIHRRPTVAAFGKTPHGSDARGKEHMNRTVLAIIAVLFVGAGAVYWTMTGQASRNAGHSMDPPGSGALGEGTAMAAVTLPAELSGQAQIGKRAFDARCADCHGADAAGRNGVAPPLVHKVYEPAHHSDMAFILAAKNGVRAHHWSFGNMPPVEGVTDGEVKMIVHYIRELQRENGIF